jgi:hypothetical protein
MDTYKYPSSLKSDLFENDKSSEYAFFYALVMLALIAGFIIGVNSVNRI